MSRIARKKVRLEARITPEQKELFRHAAALSGRRLSDFVVESVQQAAEEILHTHEVIVLSERDTKTLFELLENPPEPNEHLRAAFERYRALGLG